MFNKRGLVKIQDIPHATLAVPKFAGFKDALLTSLAIDNIEIDAPMRCPNCTSCDLSI